MSWASINGIRLHYQTQGKGPALVFAHGAGGNMMSWWQQIPYFSQRYRCASFDHRAFGSTLDSAEAPGRREFANDLRLLLDQLNIQTTAIIAQSMGGRTTVGFAVRHPERVGSLTLIGACGLFVAGAPIGDVFMMAQPERGVDHAGLRRMLFAAADTKLGNQLFPDGRGEIDDEMRRYQMLRFASFIGFRPPYFSNRSLVNRLHRVTCPALVIWGAEDAMVPLAHGHAYAAGLAGSNGLEIVSGAGHAAHLEEPDRVAGLVTEFLP